MKTSSTWNSKSIAGKMMMGLVFAAMIGNMDVVPAFGRDDHERMQYYDNDRYEHRGRRYDHGRYVYVHGRRVYQPYGYRERVYVPPPVIYAPPPPPGITIFFPPIFIRP
ncbi:MAG: hypothetical protein HY881_12650 [Deltaproteobacteria bacterium]|nr:hypothetical protein [Deltaproteobacteria bacterium]